MPKEMPEAAKEWVAALRSGKYIQGRGRLACVDNGVVKHCCLGVGCEVLGYERKGEYFNVYFEPTYYLTEEGFDSDILDTGLDEHTLSLLGIGSKLMNDLIDYNDGGYQDDPKRLSFSEIADKIEEFFNQE